MVAYLQSTEIKSLLGALVNQYVQECLEKGEIPQDFSELLRHNFLAKFVYYNKKKGAIEIGINTAGKPSSYPDIQVYSFPLEEVNDWFGDSIKREKQDLEFYGKLLSKNRISGPSQIVLMS